MEQILKDYDEKYGLRDFKFMPSFVSESTARQFLEACSALISSEELKEINIDAL